MNREEKQELVSTLHATLAEQVFVGVTHNLGLTVAEMQDLRKRMREADAGFKISKNRLMRLALAGTKFEGLADFLNGPTGIAFSKDPVAAAKVCSKFAKENGRLVILGGVLDGNVLDAVGVKALAALPSLDELRGKIVGLLQAPATKVARVLQEPAGQLARVFAARAEQGEAA